MPTLYLHAVLPLEFPVHVFIECVPDSLSTGINHLENRPHSTYTFTIKAYVALDSVIGDVYIGVPRPVTRSHPYLQSVSRHSEIIHFETAINGRS